jgi:hypothetical protein
MKSPRISGFLRAILLCAVAVFLAGCAGFDQRWAAAPAPSARDPFVGRWDGRWTSEKRPGEGGRLRCVFTQLDARHYVADFHANWKIFASEYAATFDTVRHGRQLDFEGTHTLPAIFGGVYHFAGRVTPTKFTTNYDSSYDRGTFTMERPH